VLVAVLPSVGVFEPLVLGALLVLGSTLVYEAWIAAIMAPAALAVARFPRDIEPLGVLVLLLELGIVELLAQGTSRRAIRRPGGARAGLAVVTAVAGGLAFKAILLSGIDGDVAMGGVVLVAALMLVAMAVHGRRGRGLA